MEWTRTGIFITLLVVVCACTQKNKTVTDAEPDRPEAFANSLRVRTCAFAKETDKKAHAMVI